MPARTGAQYLQGLRDRPRELWYEGQRVQDPTEHPAFRNIARSVAALYDLQHDPTLHHEMTYPSPHHGAARGAVLSHPPHPRRPGADPAA
jgi:4-hydroxyphenylacetate 3-monooxygenase